jgi:hypothetical protein
MCLHDTRHPRSWMLERHAVFWSTWTTRALRVRSACVICLRFPVGRHQALLIACRNHGGASRIVIVRSI